MTRSAWGARAPGWGASNHKLSPSKGVADILGAAYTLPAWVVEVFSPSKRATTANGDQSIKILSLQSCLDAGKAVRLLRGVRARSAQHGAANWKNLFYRREIERYGLVVQHPAPAFQESDELVAVKVGALAHDGANHRIQSGTVAAARK